MGAGLGAATANRIAGRQTSNITSVEQITYDQQGNVINTTPGVGSVAAGKPPGKPPIVGRKKPTAPKPQPAKTAKKPGTSSKADGGYHWFPRDSAGLGYHLVMGFAPYDRNTILENATKNHDLLIYLPIPQLNESFGVKVGQQALGILYGTAAKAANRLMDAPDVGKEITNVVRDGIRALREDSSVHKAMASRIAGGLGETAGATVDMVLGTTPNPNLAVNFQGVPLRAYSFTWKLTPVDMQESQTLLDIIFKLKQRMLPEKETLTLKYPDQCQIEVWGRQRGLEQLVKFKPSFLTDVKVNYSPSGVPSFFAKTSMPTEIELTLSFQETQIFTREDFMKIPQLSTEKAKA